MNIAKAEAFDSLQRSFKGMWNKNPNVVKVVNNNEYPHGPEEFKDNQIYLRPGESIYMDRAEANEFLSQYWEPILDADGNQMPKSYKKLAIIYPEIPEEGQLPQTEHHLCQRCGKILRSKDELDGHIINNHLDDLEDDKARKELQKKSGKGGGQDEAK